MSAPTTPAPLAGRSVVSDSPTGTWRHPQFDEINRRLNASTFGEKNVRTILANTFLFALTLFVPSLSSVHPSIEDTLKSMRPVPSYALLLLRLVPIFFIILACSPLIRSKDDLSDIPLTPSQRALFGLGPASMPPTPGSQYVTPPKYSRSATPRSSQSASPRVGSRDSPLGASTYSPSPLLQKAVTRDVSRRLSYGSPSPLNLGRPANESLFSVSTRSTPSPTGRSSFGISSRWIYEKSKDSPSPLKRSKYL